MEELGQQQSQPKVACSFCKKAVPKNQLAEHHKSCRVKQLMESPMPEKMTCHYCKTQVQSVNYPKHLKKCPVKIKLINAPPKPRPFDFPVDTAPVPSNDFEEYLDLFATMNTEAEMVYSDQLQRLARKKWHILKTRFQH